jgi:ABC-2 type transport system permease protein
MKYAFLVAWREFVESAKAKGFWISLFLMPLILFLSIQVPVFLEQKATPTRYYVLLDQSGEFAPIIDGTLERNYQRQVLDALNEYAAKYSVHPAAAPTQSPAPALAEFSQGNPHALSDFTSKGGKDFFLAQLQPLLRPGAPAFKEPRRQYQMVRFPDGLDTNADLGSVARDLRPYLRGDRTVERKGSPVDLYAAVLIPRDVARQIVRPHQHSAEPSHQIQFWSKDVTAAKVGFGLAQEIEQAVNGEVRRREYLAKGVDSSLVSDIEHTYAPFATLNPKKEAGKETVTGTDVIRQWAPSGFVYLLWLAIFVIIQMLLNNTIEEKSNRIIEVLLSSVTPGELMMGKLFGIAAVGLTMVGAWMAALFGILSWKAGGASQIAGQLLAILKTSNLIPLFCLYFLLGYLLYAAIILSIGSVCNTIKEAQSYMGVLTVFLMVPLTTMTYIPKDPNGGVARLLSWIPIYTPFTMMNRANADPPLVDLIGTFVLLVASTALALWMCGKIFRIGILRTGQPPRIVEMLRWAFRRQS